MSREFYQDGWGRRKNKYNNENNCLYTNQIDQNDSEECSSCSQDIKEIGNFDRRYSKDDELEYKEEKYEDDTNEVLKSSQSLVPNDSMEAPFQEKDLVKCCPFDAYGINTYKQVHTRVNLVQDSIENLYIPFTVSVKIPTGFILQPGCNYEYNLAISQKALSVNTMTQYYVYTEENPYKQNNKCNCNCMNNTPEVIKMLVSVLNGSLYYNLTLSNFVSAQPIMDTNLPVATYLNERGSIAIDKILNYAPFGYDAYADYTINVVKNKESLTLPNGRCLAKNSDCEEYQCVLANPDIDRTLNFSFVVVIKSKNRC